MKDFEIEKMIYQVYDITKNNYETYFITCKIDRTEIPISEHKRESFEGFNDENIENRNDDWVLSNNTKIKLINQSNIPSY